MGEKWLLFMTLNQKLPVTLSLFPFHPGAFCLVLAGKGQGHGRDVGAGAHLWESENRSSDALSCFSNLHLFLEISAWLVKEV